MELLSPFHLLVILAVVVLLFGGRKIPEVMRGMGEGIRSFKDGMRGEGAAPAAQPQGQATPTLVLFAAPNPATQGQPVTITATLTPAPSGSALGTVSFFNGATLLGSSNVNTSGAATLVSIGLPAGSLNVTAAYSGGTNLTAASAVLPLTVNGTYAVTT